MDFSPLPLNYKDVKKGSVYTLTTYCIRCRRETVHVVRAVSGDRFNPDGIYIDCQECKYPMYFGHTVHYFFRADCPSCGRKTVHALYEERGGLFRAGALVVKCLGCGRQTVLGR